MKERLQKVLSHAGICSRRKAEELIAAGQVRVNGKVIRELGSEADPVSDRIEVAGERIRPERKRYFLFYKPDNVITSVTDPQGRRTVMDYFRNIRERIFPVGRLDYHSEGLLLMTNDGELDNILTHPKHEVKKVYEVTVRGKYSLKLADKMSKGVRIDSVNRMAGGAFSITARDSRRPNDGQVVLTFAGSPLRLTEWTITDVQGARTRTRLTSLQPASNLSARLFQLTDPTRRPGRN